MPGVINFLLTACYIAYIVLFLLSVFKESSGKLLRILIYLSFGAFVLSAVQLVLFVSFAGILNTVIWAVVCYANYTVYQRMYGRYYPRKIKFQKVKNPKRKTSKSNIVKFKKRKK